MVLPTRYTCYIFFFPRVNVHFVILTASVATVGRQSRGSLLPGAGVALTWLQQGRGMRVPAGDAPHSQAPSVPATSHTRPGQASPSPKPTRDAAMGMHKASKDALNGGRGLWLVINVHPGTYYNFVS